MKSALTLFVVILMLGSTGKSSSFPKYSITVTELGAKSDGSEDATAIFQKALDEMGRIGGGIVNVPAGNYKIVGTLKIPAGVTLQGTFRTPPTSHYQNMPNLAGSVLLAYFGRGKRDAEPFITLVGNNATLEGMIIRYPEATPNDVPPIPYPPTVYAKNVENVGVIDCCIINPYEALHFQDSARMIIRNVFGYPSWRGLYIDACYDISRVENCHFWPFGVIYKPDDPYCLWINENAVAFEFARTDWQYVTHTFCFGYGVGYKFSKSKNGACNGSFLGIGADCCRRAVLVEDLQPYGLLITNGEFVGRWESQDSAGIEVLPGAGGGVVSLVNCAFWGPLDRAIWHRSRNTQLTVIGCNFWEWDINYQGSPALQIDSGSVTLQGNNFAPHGLLHLFLGIGTTSAIITGNQAKNGMYIQNYAGGIVQEGFNEKPPQISKNQLKNYLLNVGDAGDMYFLDGWYGAEKATEWNVDSGRKRWSRTTSLIRLPVLPNKEYLLTMDLYVPTHARDVESAICLFEEKIISLADLEGIKKVSARIKTNNHDFIILKVKSKGWRPKSVDPNSNDNRVLGIALREVSMKVKGAVGKPFEINNMYKNVLKD
ncbi:MAG: glycoside hydrolase family 55 protein [Candidatus Hydrogenedentes bacterium]|nr:glycoside hydrolase family 55 protein [Candidatus Hydrogenedentota bacterium]